MKSFTASILAFSVALSLTSASPSLRRRTGGPETTVTVTLEGATNDDNDQYTLYVPINGGIASTNLLSISRVEYNHDKYYCGFTGVDSDKPHAAPVEFDGQLGPPQGITYVSCYAKTSPTKRTSLIAVTLVGAIGAPDEPTDQYTVYVPAGSSVSTADADPNRLSISRVEYDHSKYTCHFTGVDSFPPAAPAAAPVEANGGQLGPPQTILSVYCADN
jgi:hypothetical protein